MYSLKITINSNERFHFLDSVPTYGGILASFAFGSADVDGKHKNADDACDACAGDGDRDGESDSDGDGDCDDDVDGM